MFLSVHVTFYKRASVFRTIGCKRETLGMKAIKREDPSHVAGGCQRNVIVLNILIAQSLRSNWIENNQMG